MRPSGGVSANSAEFTAIALLASLPFGATVAKPPVLIAFVHGLKWPTPFTTSTPPFTRSKLAAWYEKRGLAADRHGSPLRHSCEESTGSSATEPSLGALAKNAIEAPGERVLNTNAPICPLKSPVVTAPKSTPTTT